jgi:single-strand DNA-binding protein
MQFSINKIDIVGRAGKDAELKYTPGGTAICSVSLATTKSYKKKGAAEYTKSTTWHNVKTFGKDAELMASMIRKGDNVVVISGNTEQRSWDDKDGNKKYITEVTIDPYNSFWGVLKDYPKNEQGNGGQHHDDQSEPEQW